MKKQANDILVGIDGGGTGCRVAIVSRQGQRLGDAKGGPANPTFKPQEALSNILATIEAARQAAGLDKQTLSTASGFVGLAGIRDDTIARFIASALPFNHNRVVEDRITTVTGAMAGGDGGVAAIGTGSFVAHTVDGHAEYIGGWGFLLGDQASGAWLGHKLLRRVVLCVEGVAAHTGLTRETLDHFDNNASRVFDFSNSAGPADFAGFAPRVVAAAKDGDQTATAMMQAGAFYIVKSLTALGYRHDTPLCLTGGLGPHYASFLPPAYGAKTTTAKGSALEGALLLAAKMGPAT
ncbi:BadF/BadG/BcrA/BcrD ATPase family protein [Profundibacter sp.]